jgi:hypothetical protein
MTAVGFFLNLRARLVPVLTVASVSHSIHTLRSCFLASAIPASIHHSTLDCLSNSEIFKANHLTAIGMAILGGMDTGFHSAPSIPGARRVTGFSNLGDAFPILILISLPLLLLSFPTAVFFTVRYEVAHGDGRCGSRDQRFEGALFMYLRSLRILLRAAECSASSLVVLLTIVVRALDLPAEIGLRNSGVCWGSVGLSEPKGHQKPEVLAALALLVAFFVLVLGEVPASYLRKSQASS